MSSARRPIKNYHTRAYIRQVQLLTNITICQKISANAGEVIGQFGLMLRGK